LVHKLPNVYWNWDDESVYSYFNKINADVNAAMNILRKEFPQPLMVRE